MATKHAYYWSKLDEDTYHDNQECPAGKQIKAENRVEGSKAPAGRDLCERCHE